MTSAACQRELVHLGGVQAAWAVRLGFPPIASLPGAVSPWYQRTGSVLHRTAGDGGIQPFLLSH